MSTLVRINGDHLPNQTMKTTQTL